MHYHYLSPLAVTLALSLANPSFAAVPVSLQNETLNQLGKEFDLNQSGLSLKADNLTKVSAHIDRNQIKHIRMQQRYYKFPVHGGYAIIHTPSTAKSMVSAQSNSSLNGQVFKNLVNDLGKPKADFIKNSAKALKNFKAQFSNQQVSEEDVIPMVYIDDENRAHWAYKVSVLVHYRDKIPARPTAIMNAENNSIFVQWDDIKTKKIKVQGEGAGGNRKVGEIHYGQELPYLNITQDTLKKTCYMENDEVKVIDMLHDYNTITRPMKFPCAPNSSNIYKTGKKEDGYDKQNGAFSPSNDALYAGYVIKHMYHDWYKVEVLKKHDGSPMQLVMRVHYGDAYENAYWDGRQMTFGDGDTMMYPLVSLGVGAHEISHGFTEQHSDLEYYGQSGGINEAFSDMAAQAAEYYSLGKNDWTIGSEIMKEDSGYDALRYLDKPSRDGESIDSADQYHSGIDVHYSSGVFNRLFYLIATSEGWNTRSAFDVMVKANMDYWTPYADFQEAGCGVVSAARDLKLSVKDVQNALNEVGIKSKLCSIKS